MSYNRLVISGKVGAGADIWSTGINYQPTLGPYVISPTDLSAWAAAAFAWVSANLSTSLSAGLSANGTIEEIRTYYYASDPGPATFVGTATGLKAGTSTANNPLPTSMVFSTMTAFAGRSYRGRMYWPALSTTIQSTGTFASSLMTVIATEAATLIRELGEAATIATDLAPVIVSKTAGAVTPVTQVRVGNVPDTQRRRRNNLVEVYQTASI